METIEYTYIPLWNVISNSNFTILDGVGLVAYIGFFILAIWLIKKGGKKDVQKPPDER